MATMDEEPVSDDLEEAARKYADIRMSNYETAFYAFMSGAEWQKTKNGSITEDLEKTSKEWLRPKLDKSYANYGEEKMMELTHFDGYAMLDAIEFGAKWKEEQMMKNAINAEVAVPVYEGKDIKLTQLVTTDVKLDVGDKVKLILIKRE